MNSIDIKSAFWAQDLQADDLTETASNAICASSDHNTLRLHGLLQQGLVDATTQTSMGETLLMLAVRIDRPQAFEDLLLDFPEHRAKEFNRQDRNGDTVLHHLARHRSHEDFAPGIQASWRRILRNFLDVFNPTLDWGVRNDGGDTALELASRLGKSHLVAMMKSYKAKSAPP